MDPEAGKRRRDQDADDAAAPAPEPVKPRKRRFDTTGGASGGGEGASGGTSSVVHLQADIASLQQQVTALYSLAGVPEDQRASAIAVLQGVISAKQADLGKAMAASGLSSGAGGAISSFAAASPQISIPSSAAAAAQGARIYVGAMPYEATELDVRTLFSQFGNIVKVDMSFEPLTGKTKGYCFIAYDNAASADRAIATMHGTVLQGRAIKVSRPNAAGSGPTPAPAFGTIAPGIAAAAAAALGGGGGSSSGGLSADLLSAADEAATAALRVKAAAASGSVAFRVYVGGVPTEITGDHLRQIFSPFGAIRAVSMLPSQEPGVAGHRGYGFIGARFGGSFGG